jgi:hypothetical protein
VDAGMNVKEGDRARVVNTGTRNDGAVVIVLELDRQWTERLRKPVWAVRGDQMLGFAGKIPKTVQAEGVLPDANLRRVENERDAVDRRTDISSAEPERTAIAAAAREAMENRCPTT